MNKTCLIYCIFIMSIIWGACNEKNESYPNEIIISPTENVTPLFESNGGSIAIQFYTSTQWNATIEYSSTDKNWINLSPNRGEKGEHIITISASPNELYSERKAIVAIVCEDVSKVITVTQKAVDEGDTRISVNFNKISLDAYGDVFSIKTFGYADFEIECMDDWCHVHKNIAGTFNSLEIEVDSNETDTRYSNIILKSKSGKAIHNIQVKQLSKAEQISTDVIKSSSRSSLFLMFTATWCPYSPIMDAGLSLASDSWKSNIEIVKVHVNNSGLYCVSSIDLSSFYENNTTPTGILDGRIKINNQGNANVVSQSILNFLTEGKSLNLQGAAIEGSANIKKGEVCVDIKLSNLDEDTYILQTWLLEDNLVAGQEDYINECFHENYIHNGILRESLSLVLGDEFTIKRESSKNKEISYIHEVPAYCNKDNLRVLIILQRRIEKNGTTFCFPYYVDNCISVPIGGRMNGGGNENIIPGEDIDFN